MAAARSSVDWMRCRSPVRLCWGLVAELWESCGSCIEVQHKRGFEYSGRICRASIFNFVCLSGIHPS